MPKTILVTGSTDGIGLETVKMLLSSGHDVLVHGRSPDKLKRVADTLSQITRGDRVKRYVADLSRLKEVEAFAGAVAEEHDHLDVLINNAGVFKESDPVTPEGLDVRFVVNTIAPYLLARKLLPLLGTSGRIVNVTSAAQSPVDSEQLAGGSGLSDMEVYAQSKLALIMWSRSMALSLGDDGPAIIAVNPGSLLGSKMVKQAFGIEGGDLGIGSNILCRAALADEFATASGRYFDNDAGRFASPHKQASDRQTCDRVVTGIEAILAESA